MVKLYVAEPGHELVRPLGRITISAVTQVEVPAALWRKHRTGELSARQAQHLTVAFANDVGGAGPRFVTVGVSPRILQRGVSLVARHPLRAYDAVQLATALAVIQADPSMRFASFDAQLNAAAAAEGLQLL